MESSEEQPCRVLGFYELMYYVYNAGFWRNYQVSATPYTFAAPSILGLIFSMSRIDKT